MNCLPFVGVALSSTVVRSTLPLEKKTVCLNTRVGQRHWSSRNRLEKMGGIVFLEIANRGLYHIRSSLYTVRSVPNTIGLAVWLLHRARWIAEISPHIYSNIRRKREIFPLGGKRRKKHTDAFFFSSSRCSGWWKTWLIPQAHCGMRVYEKLEQYYIFKPKLKYYELVQRAA